MVKLAFGATWFEKSRLHIRKIVAHSEGRLTEEGIRAALDAGQYWLVVAVENEDVQAAMVLNPIRWATGLNEIQIVGLAGMGMKNWLHLHGELIQRLKAMGFSLIRIEGRPGWARKMKSYELKKVCLEYRF